MPFDLFGSVSAVLGAPPRKQERFFMPNITENKNVSRQFFKNAKFLAKIAIFVLKLAP